MEIGETHWIGFKVSYGFSISLFNHLCLIQACMQDLVESEQWGGCKSINDEPHNVFDEILDWSFSSTISLVKGGHVCFSLMFQHGVQPAMDHYSCIVDLLGRCRLLDEALEFIQKMPISPNAVIWGSLLSSSRLHGNVRIGVHTADSLLLCVTTFLQLVNLYASTGCWDKARL
ncbi:hypothetical protein GIB67_016791 [Kingdonia uniflora]|uniref:Pentatricopeptide repeat-containing protein n=1 Tax=Kingdonia uniflora TaxID=39325 RepID=A0A7J7LS04_9MAGN|nr:hypothetical protein GIB67_016791 [Kingdonia uniflora]